MVGRWVDQGLFLIDHLKFNVENVKIRKSEDHKIGRSGENYKFKL
jgi:hypothetical protein